MEDNPDDVLLVKRAFERAGLFHRIETAANGMEGIAYLNAEAPYGNRAKYPLPGLVLLDIKMPIANGFEVLRWIRRRPEFMGLCVIMLTTSDAIGDVNLAYQLGANSFLVKPLDFWNAAELSRSVGRLMEKR